MFPKPLSDVTPLVPRPRLEAVPEPVAVSDSRAPIVLASVCSFVAGVLTSGAALLLQG